MRIVLLASLALTLPLASAATAADKRVMVTSFDRVRVEGPFQVTVATGRGAGATMTGDARQLDRTEVRVDGTTLVVRPVADSSRRIAPSAVGPVTVVLTTPGLRAATVWGGGALTVVGRGRLPRLDLSVAGAGSIGWTGADADAATVTVLGNGQVTLAGRATRARVSVNGAGKVDAGALQADELTVRVDGPGEVAARARYTATVTNTGLGRVGVAGSPKCIVNSPAGGPVSCGAGAAP